MMPKTTTTVITNSRRPHVLGSLTGEILPRPPARCRGRRACRCAAFRTPLRRGAKVVAALPTVTSCVRCQRGTKNHVNRVERGESHKQWEGHDHEVENQVRRRRRHVLKIDPEDACGVLPAQVKESGPIPSLTGRFRGAQGKAVIPWSGMARQSDQAPGILCILIHDAKNPER